MKTYSIPSIISVDSSKMHFLKNQATCDPNFTLNGQGLVPSPGIANTCGRAVASSDTVEICLSGSVSDPSQLSGLILTGFLGEQITIDSCVDIGSGTGAACPGTAYLCTDVDGSVADDRCITSILCPDGTTLTNCPVNPCAAS